MKLSLVVPFLAALIGIANAESVGTIRGNEVRDPADGERTRSHEHHSKPRGDVRSSHDRHGSERVGTNDKPRDQQDEMIRTSTHVEDRNGDKPRSYDRFATPRGEARLAFDGHAVPIEGSDWDNQATAAVDKGRYFLFRPEHWKAVFGSLPATGEATIYEVEQQRNGEVVWQGSVMIWIWDSTRPDIGLPDGFEAGRRDPVSASGQWQTGDFILPVEPAPIDLGTNCDVFFDDFDALTSRPIPSEDSSGNALLEITNPTDASKKINLVDLLNDYIEGQNTIPVPKVLMGDEIKSLGASCEKISFVGHDERVLALGLEYSAPTGTTYSVCMAVNPCDHIYALSQSGVLKLVKPVPPAKLTLEADSIGFALNKGLSRKTLNKMWSGDSGTTAIDYRTVDGHLAMTATGTVEIEAGPKATVGLVCTASLLVDLDPANNGVLPFDEGVDFEFLLSAEATPVIELRTNDDTVALDLNGLLTSMIDLYVKVLPAGAHVELAASVDMSLNGLCLASPLLLLYCEIFNADGRLKGEARFFADNDGFGIRFDVEGHLTLIDMDDTILDFIEWPDLHARVDLMLSVEMTKYGKLEICMQESDKRVTCLDYCKSDSQCGPNEYCHWSGTCIEKHGDGYVICTDNNQCDNYCVAGMCNECPVTDSSEGCNSDQFCEGLTHTCQPKRGDGGACLSQNVCKDGHWCIGGFCQECREIDSTRDCPSGQFCSGPLYNCVDQRGDGGACLSQSVCKDGHWCVRGFCQECREIDSTTDCPSGQFCRGPDYNCENQRSDGGACLSSSACKNYCVAGFCQECSGQSHCGSGKFCTGWPSYNCNNKKSKGSWCGSDKECHSNNCGLTWTGVKCK
ncbi:unnamed protein product [Cylindrotheca closterium]|uniref:Uncharacterized protein n=1 Tax=Cylindrotheca closterium TaxID=2856 RepID=A0AAD2FZE7_9STRA|nr:unnamed protein product [Cylindrotheca closterium]